MQFVSWNVNGLRAVCGKGFSDIFKSFDADFVCLQETKLQEGQIDLAFDGYESFWNYAERKGYSGTVIFTKHKPQAVTTGIGIAEHDTEGRVVTLDMGKFYLVNVYTPNAQPELARLEYRMSWELEFMNYLKHLDAEKPVIVCGDMNVAHNEIDLRNPKTNHGNPGFSDEERACMTRLLDAGFIDTFRYLYPDQKDAYSWWSYRGRAREKNVGWRIDYFLVSKRLADQIQKAEIYSTVLGSDHCPVALTLNI
jgi:exodeoxyribonuclease-3